MVTGYSIRKMTVLVSVLGADGSFSLHRHLGMPRQK